MTILKQPDAKKKELSRNPKLPKPVGKRSRQVRWSSRRQKPKQEKRCCKHKHILQCHTKRTWWVLKIKHSKSSSINLPSRRVQRYDNDSGKPQVKRNSEEDGSDAVGLQGGHITSAGQVNYNSKWSVFPFTVRLGDMTIYRYCDILDHSSLFWDIAGNVISFYI